MERPLFWGSLAALDPLDVLSLSGMEFAQLSNKYYIENQFITREKESLELCGMSMEQLYDMDSVYTFNKYIPYLQALVETQVNRRGMPVKAVAHSSTSTKKKSVVDNRIELQPNDSKENDVNNVNSANEENSTKFHESNDRVKEWKRQVSMSNDRAGRYGSKENNANNFNSANEENTKFRENNDRVKEWKRNVSMSNDRAGRYGSKENGHHEKPWEKMNGQSFQPYQRNSARAGGNFGRDNRNESSAFRPPQSFGRAERSCVKQDDDTASLCSEFSARTDCNAGNRSNCSTSDRTTECAAHGQLPLETYDVIFGAKEHGHYFVVKVKDLAKMYKMQSQLAREQLTPWSLEGVDKKVVVVHQNERYRGLIKNNAIRLVDLGWYLPWDEVSDDVFNLPDSFRSSRPLAFPVHIGEEAEITKGTQCTVEEMGMFDEKVKRVKVKAIGRVLAGLGLEAVRNGQIDVKPVRNVQIDVKPVRNVQIDVNPVRNGQVDVNPVRNGQIDDKPVRNVQIDFNPVRNVQIDVNPVRNGQVDVKPVRNVQIDVEPVGNGVDKQTSSCDPVFQLTPKVPLSVIYILRDDNFPEYHYVQNTSYSSMYDTLQQVASEETNLRRQPSIGALCFAIIEGEWVRSRVISLRPLTVYHLDYGSTQEVDAFDDLKSIPLQWCAHPPMAYRVKFLHPATNDAECTFGTAFNITPLGFSDGVHTVLKDDEVPLPEVVREAKAEAEKPTQGMAKMTSGEEVESEPIRAQTDYKYLRAPVSDNSMQLNKQVEVMYLQKDEDNPEHAWVQVSVSDVQQWQNICKESEALFVNPPEPGDFCVSICEGIYCRAKILSTHPLSIYYLDFGYSEQVDVDDIAPLPRELAGVQPLAFKVEYGGALIEYGDSLLITPTHRKGDVYVVVREIAETPASENFKGCPISQTRHLELNKAVEALFVEDDVKDATVKWVQEPQLFDMTVRWTEICEEHTARFAELPGVGDFCVLLYEEVWCRGQVVSVEPMTVFCLDYGNKCEAALSELRPLPAQLGTEKPFAYRIRFLHEANASVTYEYFEKLNITPVEVRDGVYVVLKDDEVVPTVEASPPSVKASPPSVKAGPPSVKASPPTVEASPPSVKASPPTVEASPPSVKASPPTVEPSPPSVKASPPSVESLVYASPVVQLSLNQPTAAVCMQSDEFNHQYTWMQDAADVETLDTFASSLAESEETLAQPHLGDLCGREYEGYWCRGQVVGLNPLTVFYFDYGNTERVSLCDLKPLPAQCQTPAMAYRAHFPPSERPEDGKFCRIIPRSFENNVYFAELAS